VAKTGSIQLFDLYERMDRLEELIEDMEELGVTTRDEAEQMIIELDGRIEELESRADSGD
jgi:DNA phosphorothioation-dependent restriction protein DptG